MLATGITMCGGCTSGTTEGLKQVRDWHHHASRTPLANVLDVDV
jgi:hypothetical protein